MSGVGDASAWIASLDLCVCPALAITYQFDAVQHQSKRLARKEKTTPCSVNLMRSQVMYWAAQVKGWLYELTDPC
jgi:hypothetical protein